MIAWSHHNFERFKKERRKKMIQNISVLVLSATLGFLLFF